MIPVRALTPFVFFALACVSLGLSSRAFGGNGVERGSVAFDNGSMPASLDGYLESLIVRQCDLKGASKVTATSLQQYNASNAGDEGVSYYRLQYQVEFRHLGRTAIIFVEAVVHGADAGMGGGKVLLRSLASPICRPLP